MGDSITEGTISSWKKSIGETVKVDEVICVIDTDKVSLDIHADVAGKIIHHAAQEGETVYVGGDLVSLNTSMLQENTTLESPSSTNTANSSGEPLSKINNEFSAYIPMIKFPNRNQIYPNIDTTNSMSGIAQSQVPHNTILVHNNKIKEVINLDFLPFPIRNLTDEEIEIINSGGVSGNNESVVGKWKLYIDKAA